MRMLPPMWWGIFVLSRLKNGLEKIIGELQSQAVERAESVSRLAVMQATSRKENERRKKLYITNGDLNFLIKLENELGKEESWSERVVDLWALVDKLIKQRARQNERAREYIAERRISDKNYARTKKGERNGRA